MKIYVKIKNDPGSRPGEHDRCFVTHYCVVHCCWHSKTLWESQEIENHIHIHPGYCGGGPALSVKSDLCVIGVECKYCPGCGTKIEQNNPKELPENLEWEPVLERIK